MHTLELLVDEIDDHLHAAVVRKGIVDALYVDSKDALGSWASLYLGKVVKVDKQLDAAIVDLGLGFQGFLPAKHVHVAGADRSEIRTGIAHLLKAGQMIVVQVKAEGRRQSAHESGKLPRLTTRVQCCGQFLSYSPVLNQVAISSQVENENLYKIAAHLQGAGGWIIHPNADGADEADILFESKNLLEVWHGVQAQIQVDGDTPRMLLSGPSAAQRALNDYGVQSFEHIHAGNRKILGDIIAWSEKSQPALATSKRLRLFKKEKPAEILFDLRDVGTVLDMLSDTVVPLPSGGSIIIETVNALTIIDVNQGEGGDVVSVNVEAAQEIARQTQLRNLNGIILVDFINMAHKADRHRVTQILEDAYTEDYAGAQVHGFTRLGLMEITRKRRTASYAEIKASAASR